MANADALRERIISNSEAMMRAAVQDDLMGALLAAAPSGEGTDRPSRGEPILVQSSYAQQVSTGSVISWIVGFTAPQGEWTEFGTEPHPIFPTRPGGVLHWIDDAGEDVFARYVLDVSMPARPWFFPTISERWPAVLEENLSVLEAA